MNKLIEGEVFVDSVGVKSTELKDFCSRVLLLSAFPWRDRILSFCGYSGSGGSNGAHLVDFFCIMCIGYAVDDIREDACKLLIGVDGLFRS